VLLVSLDFESLDFESVDFDSEDFDSDDELSLLLLLDLPESPPPPDFL